MPAQASSVAMIETGVDLGCIGPSREIPSGPVSGALILREDCPAGLNAPPGPEPARGGPAHPTSKKLLTNRQIFNIVFLCLHIICLRRPGGG